MHKNKKNEQSLSNLQRTKLQDIIIEGIENKYKTVRIVDTEINERNKCCFIIFQYIGKTGVNNEYESWFYSIDSNDEVVIGEELSELEVEIFFEYYFNRKKQCLKNAEAFVKVISDDSVKSRIEFTGGINVHNYNKDEFIERMEELMSDYRMWDILSED